MNPQNLDDKDHKVGKPKYEQPLEEEDHKSFNFIQKIGLLRAQKKQENLTSDECDKSFLRLHDPDHSADEYVHQSIRPPSFTRGRICSVEFGSYQP